MEFKAAENVKRRKWDKEHYKQKAEERERNEDEAEGKKDDRVYRPSGGKEEKEEFLPAPEGAQGPAGSARAFLRGRAQRLNLETLAGSTKVVASNQGIASGGFWCKVCECMLKDSNGYLDHVNGKKHQKKLGYSMRVERSTVDQVRDRLKMNKRKLEKMAETREKESALEGYEKKLAKAQEEEEIRKERRREERLKKKKEEEEEINGDADPEMMSMMGFAGFGSSKK